MLALYSNFNIPWLAHRKLLRLRLLLSTSLNRLACKLCGVSIGTNSRFLGRCTFRRYPGSTISIGDYFFSTGGRNDNPIGLSIPTLLQTLNPQAILLIGNNAGLSGVVVSCTSRIEIGSNVLVGANARIFDSDFHPVNSSSRRYDRSNIYTEPILIGDNCWIGAHSLILPGTQLAENVIVAAGAVVKGKFSSNLIVGGVPARVLRSL